MYTCVSAVHQFKQELSLLPNSMIWCYILLFLRFSTNCDDYAFKIVIFFFMVCPVCVQYPPAKKNQGRFAFSPSARSNDSFILSLTTQRVCSSPLPSLWVMYNKWRNAGFPLTCKKTCQILNQDLVVLDVRSESRIKVA